MRFSGIMFLDDADLDGAPIVRVGLRTSPGGGREIVISSRRSTSAWDSHATMSLVLDASDGAVVEPLDREGVLARCTDHVEASRFYASTGNDYRGEFRAMAEAWATGSAEVQARLPALSFHPSRPLSGSLPSALECALSPILTRSAPTLLLRYSLAFATTTWSATGRISARALGLMHACTRRSGGGRMLAARFTSPL